MGLMGCSRACDDPWAMHEPKLAAGLQDLPAPGPTGPLPPSVVSGPPSKTPSTNMFNYLRQRADSCRPPALVPPAGPPPSVSKWSSIQNTIYKCVQLLKNERSFMDFELATLRPISNKVVGSV